MQSGVTLVMHRTHFGKLAQTWRVLTIHTNGDV